METSSKREGKKLLKKSLKKSFVKKKRETPRLLPYTNRIPTRVVGRPTYSTCYWLASIVHARVRRASPLFECVHWRLPCGAGGT